MAGVPVGCNVLQRLRVQVAEICRRFRRYRSSAFAESLDDDDDREVEGDGVNPQELETSGVHDESGFFTKARARKSLKNVGKSIAWTEAGVMIQTDVEDKDDECSSSGVTIEEGPVLSEFIGAGVEHLFGATTVNIAEGKLIKEWLWKMQCIRQNRPLRSQGPSLICSA